MLFKYFSFRQHPSRSDIRGSQEICTEMIKSKTSIMFKCKMLLMDGIKYIVLWRHSQKRWLYVIQ